MAQVLVRNLDDQVVAALRRKADLRATLTAAVRLSGKERAELAKRIRAMTPKGVEQTDSAELIREDRDSR
jgi:plasmid stability protein